MSSRRHDSENSPPEELPSISKLRKIPPIPSRQRANIDFDEGFDLGNNDSDNGDSNIIGPSTLGLNQIRTRSAPLTLEQVNSLGTPQDFENLESQGNDGADARPKLSSASQQSAATSTEQGGICMF